MDILNIIKKILGYSIIFVHSIIIPISLYILLFIRDFYSNFILLVYTTLVIINWIVLGNCILTPIENYLLKNEKKYNDGSDRSIISVFIEKYTKINDKSIYIFFILLTLTINIVLLFKICYLYI
jgi:hypothetical protein